MALILYAASLVANSAAQSTASCLKKSTEEIGTPIGNVFDNFDELVAHDLITESTIVWGFRVCQDVEHDIVTSFGLILEPNPSNDEPEEYLVLPGHELEPAGPLTHDCRTMKFADP